MEQNYIMDFLDWSWSSFICISGFKRNVFKSSSSVRNTTDRLIASLADFTLENSCLLVSSAQVKDDLNTSKSV